MKLDIQALCWYKGKYYQHDEINRDKMVMVMKKEWELQGVYR
jgi:hypothetical protein